METLIYYREKWRQCIEGCTSDEFAQLAEEVALTFLDSYYYNDSFEAGYIELLCEMSTVEDEELANNGTSALFGIIVESLCDDFEELQSEAYNRLMSHILVFCISLPAASPIVETMSRFGLRSFEDIYDRAERLRKASHEARHEPRHEPRHEGIKKVIFLSRVTIGADVAITSVLVQRTAQRFAAAELVVLGNSKTHSLFAANPSVRVRNVDYVRRGGLMERLASWLDVLQAVNEETGNLESAQYLVIDTDSRLSQLGVLPVADEDSYLLFNSRSSFAHAPRLSISEMANHWFDNVLPDNLPPTQDTLDTTLELNSSAEGYCTGAAFSYSRIWLSANLTEKAESFVNDLREAGAKLVIAVNLGVGGNTRKRVGDEFEIELILRLLDEEGTTIILDKGFGAQELQQAQNILAAAKDNGHSVADVSFTNIDNSMTILKGARLIAVQADIDEAAAIISSAGQFIGYDSACQHIAAAAGVATYTVFAGSNNTRFVRRWRPFGRGKTEIIHVDTLTYPPKANRGTVIRRLMHLRSDEA